MRGIIPVTGQVIEALRMTFIDSKEPPLGGRPTTIEHRPGMDVALDGLFVGDCPGLVWANVIRLFRSSEFPHESDSLGPCLGLPVATIQVGAARCVSTVDDHGYPPTADAMEREALVGLDDAHRLERALCVAAKNASNLNLTHTATWSAIEPIGPQGGVLAWVGYLTVQLA